MTIGFEDAESIWITIDDPQDIVVTIDDPQDIVMTIAEQGPPGVDGTNGTDGTGSFAAAVILMTPSLTPAPGDVIYLMQYLRIIWINVK